MAGAAHDVVEGDFEDAEGFDGAEVAVSSRVWALSQTVSSRISASVTPL